MPRYHLHNLDQFLSLWKYDHMTDSRKVKCERKFVRINCLTNKLVQGTLGHRMTSRCCKRNQKYSKRIFLECFAPECGECPPFCLPILFEGEKAFSDPWGELRESWFWWEMTCVHAGGAGFNNQCAKSLHLSVTTVTTVVIKAKHCCAFHQYQLYWLNSARISSAFRSLAVQCRDTIV